MFEGWYPNSIESLQYVVEKTIIISSVGMCQEICSNENIGQFAVKVGEPFASDTNQFSVVIKYNLYQYELPFSYST